MADDRAIACRVDAFNAVPRRSGLSRCNQLRKSRPIMSRAGDVSVLACRALRYCNKKLASRCCKDFSSHLETFNECFSVCTKRSARPFVAGW